LESAARRAGIQDDFHPHDLRHYRITYWLAEGKRLAPVQKAAGHGDPGTTSWYTHLLDGDLLVLVDRDQLPTHPQNQTGRPHSRAAGFLSSEAPGGFEPP